MIDHISPLGGSKPERSYRDRERLSSTFIHIIMVALSILMILPLLQVISISFSEEQDIAKYGYALFPRRITFAAYEYIFNNPTQIINSYGISLATTFLGTAIGLLLTAMLAYSITRRTYRLRKGISFFLFFTLLFSGGMIPAYILISQYLQMTNTLWVLFVPTMISAWNVLLLRAFFGTLPQELLDAAKIDGASEWRIFFQIVVPLSTPALATIGTFMVLMYWNDWQTALLYVNDPNLYPLQYLLYQISSNIEFLAQHTETQQYNIQPPVETVRMAMVVVATGPIALVFLFLQKYFVRGITLGGLKGD